MRISAITRASMAGAIALVALDGVAIWASSRAVEAERMATARQLEFRHLSADLRNASLFLTNEARRYAVFGEKRHFVAYWREVNETKTRDRVVNRLKVGATAAELGLIEQAKANSDALIATEDAAMRRWRRRIWSAPER